MSTKKILSREVWEKHIFKISKPNLQSGVFFSFEASSQAYSGTLTRREIARANASLGELRRDKEKLSLPISCEFVRVKAS